MIINTDETVYVIFITAAQKKCPLPGITVQTVNSLTEFQISTIAKFIEKNGVTYSHFSYIALSHVAQKLACRTGVEIHDVLHLRAQQFVRFGYSPSISITMKDELQHLIRFDHIFSISTDETNYLRELGLHCHYLPPTIEPQSTPKPSKLMQLGIIGSSATPNIDGLEQVSNHNKFT